jgi:tetratricopeptide (TPR) repeat protein
MYSADVSNPVQYSAVLSLSTDAARPVLRALASRDGTVAEAALLKLGIIGNPADVGFMLEVTRTLAPNERRGAAYAFEQMAEAETLAPLRDLMGDQDPAVNRYLSDAALNAEPKALYRLGLLALENGDLGVAETLLERAAATNRTERAWFARVALARVYQLAGNRASASAILAKVLEEPKRRAIDPRLVLEAEMGTAVLRRWDPQGIDPLEWIRVARKLADRPEEERRLLLRRYPEFVGVGHASFTADPVLARERDHLESTLAASRAGS